MIDLADWQCGRFPNVGVSELSGHDSVGSLPAGVVHRLSELGMVITLISYSQTVESRSQEHFKIIFYIYLQNI